MQSTEFVHYQIIESKILISRDKKIVEWNHNKSQDRGTVYEEKGSGNEGILCA